MVCRAEARIAVTTVIIGRVDLRKAAQVAVAVREGRLHATRVVISP